MPAAIGIDTAAAQNAALNKKGLATVWVSSIAFHAIVGRLTASK
jgi:hypothetical protein